MRGALASLALAVLLGCGEQADPYAPPVEMHVGAVWWDWGDPGGDESVTYYPERLGDPTAPHECIAYQQAILLYQEYRGDQRASPMLRVHCDLAVDWCWFGWDEARDRAVVGYCEPLAVWSGGWRDHARPAVVGASQAGP